MTLFPVDAPEAILRALHRTDDPRAIADQMIKGFESTHGPIGFVELTGRDAQGHDFTLTRFRGDDGLDKLATLDTSAKPGDAAAVHGKLHEIAVGPARYQVHEHYTSAIDDPHRALLNPYRSLAAIPIFSKNHPAWIVLLFRSPECPLQKSGGDLVWQANLFGAFLEWRLLAAELSQTKLVMRAELDAMAAIQRALLPRVDEHLPGLDIAFHFEPCTQAGGDLIDFTRLPDGRWALLIADASGHGASAAVVAAMVSATLRAFRPSVADGRQSIADVMTFANDHLCERPIGGSFVTAFLACWDPQSRRLEYCRAGHPPPLLRRRGTIVEIDQAADLPLGILADCTYRAASMQLEADDLLVLFTDGITEAIDALSEEFGTRRLSDAVNVPGNANETLRRVVDQIAAFVAGRPSKDDRTVFILRVLP